MPELLAPAGSAEAISAAVQSGADAVCASLQGGAAGSQYDISEADFARAGEFCRVRGVKLYAVVETSPFDDDFSAALDVVRRAYTAGADAVIVHDLGLILASRRAVPELPVHAGSRLCIHTLEGVRLAAAMGVKRVALAPELPLEELAAIRAESPVELEVMVHGPICPAYGGQCLLPSAAGRASAFRTVCTGFCREHFPVETARKTAPMRAADLCLAGRLRELRELDLAAVRIEGRDRRPEYVAAVTGVYAGLLGTGRRFSEEDLKLLREAFPVPLFTDGAFGGEKQQVPGSPPPVSESFYTAIRRDYLNHEFQRVPVRFSGRVTRNEAFQLTAEDDRGHVVRGEGSQPELAFHHELDLAYLTTELSKTGGTPFLCGGVQFEIERGLFIPQRSLGVLRDRLLKELMELRKPLEPRKAGKAALPPKKAGPSEPPVLTVSLRRCAQLSDRLLDLAPPVLYLPLPELLSGDPALTPFLRSEEIALCAVLPSFIRDGELPEVTAALRRVRDLGVREVLAGNLGHLVLPRKLGFEVRGDLTLNARNSAALYALGAFRLKSVTLSPELSLSRVRAVSKELPAELVVYGRLPLMTTDRCVIRDVLGTCSCDGLSGIADRKGLTYPVTHGFHCRNTVWSAKKLFLAGRSRDYMAAGLWGVRLMFTTESAGECVQVVERYLEMNHFEPASYTTGLYQEQL